MDTPVLQMSDTLHIDDAENSADNNSNAENPYADAPGEPVTCDWCGEYVAVHYHPPGDFPANYAGFVAHCACAAGAQLSAETVEGLDPRWYAEMVLDAKVRDEDWLEYYIHGNYDASKSTGDGA